MADYDGQPLSSRARRRLLVALGYGAANAAVVSMVGWRARYNSTPSSDPLTSTLVDLTAAVGMGEPPPLPDAASQPGPEHTYQQVIANGRVMDPGSRFDAVANVGIDDGVVTAISLDPLVGTETIDAAGLVVAPGFIDLLSYEPNPFGVWYKLADGVTTNLAMHGVNNYAEPFFRRYEGTTPIHFGGAFHQHFMRATDLGAGVEDELSPLQLDGLDALARANLQQGFAGISFSPEYSPGTSAQELLRLSATAVEFGHVVFFHVRYSDPHPPGTSDEAIDEVLDIAAKTGASVHIEHLSSTGATFKMAEVLDRLDAARASGVDVTACVYPYDFWGTFLASSRFALGWQERFGLTYTDLQVAGTDRRLDEATFDQALAENLLVAALGSIPEEEVQMALARDWVMVSSDAILNPDLNNHPRAAGTFARTLGRYVRDLGVLDLQSALAKMTILPAERVEAMIPDMARKGRLRRGADADIVVFDPATIADQATVAIPNLPSVGIHWVLVEGQVALQAGQPMRNVRAGRALKSAGSI
ncbi:MAG: amidohydrolase family protein [Actinomycetia bacterium]|nr:amidohydrolase family protein [Actinomycetes bacterium]